MWQRGFKDACFGNSAFQRSLGKYSNVMATIIILFPFNYKKDQLNLTLPNLTNIPFPNLTRDQGHLLFVASCVVQKVTNVWKN